MMKDVMIGTWAWGPGNNGSKMVFGQNYDEKSWLFRGNGG